MINNQPHVVTPYTFSCRSSTILFSSSSSSSSSSSNLPMNQQHTAPPQDTASRRGQGEATAAFAPNNPVAPAFNRSEANITSK
mgnify:CR=1 FL=1